MEGPAQLETLQLLLFLLPPCHSDTLLRLLRFLAEVARHAESSWDPQGHQVRLLQGSCCGKCARAAVLELCKPGWRLGENTNPPQNAGISVVGEGGEVRQAGME